MMRQIQSTRFGVLEVADTQCVRFLHGLPGFPEETAFAYLPAGENSPFAYLQSRVTPDLTFVAVNPFHFFPEYVFELPDEVVEELELLPEEGPEVLAIVRIPEKTEDMTANLVAPIVINWRIQIARQVVLEKSDYSLRQRLFAETPVTGREP